MYLSFFPFPSPLSPLSLSLSLSLSRYESLLKEKEDLETAYEALQEEVEEMLRGGGVESDRASNKDTRTLKKIIKNMEVVKNDKSVQKL